MGITIKDVAREAEVCIATVSRAYNSPQQVSKEKLEKIMKAAKKLNYHPNALARGLITRSTKTIGIVIPDINNIFYPCVAQGIEDFCSEAGYLSFICNTYNNIEKEKKYINTLLNQCIDGIIFVGTRPIKEKDNMHIIELAKRTPVVMVYDCLEGDNICSIYTNDVSGGYKATKYLLDRGHKRIAFFSSSVMHTTYVYKQYGYEKALAEYGVPFDDRYIFKAEPYVKGGFEAMKAMWKKFDGRELPTGIFAISDQMALGVYRFCNENGLAVPGDMDVVGYSRTKIVNEVFENLATIDQMPYETGRLAAETLIRISKKNALFQKKIIIEPQLVINK